MAIIIDPDLLDRNQVIYGTKTQTISVYPVGAITVAEQQNGATILGTSTFAGAGFLSATVGDILVLKNGSDAGHYRITNIIDDFTIEVEGVESEPVSFIASESGLVYNVRQSSGGTVASGVTLQALYSFTKEEWHTDLELVGGDDLIKHEFPFESITTESFEIGGSEQHANWKWHNNYTKKNIRTAGWSEKDVAGTILEQWTGIVTLGDLQQDTRVYYQQDNATAAPQNFKFLGSVNEPLLVFTSTGTDKRNYLKLFARKKGYTYAQASINDIGVVSLEPKTNRFSLSHKKDPAIVTPDSEILGRSPFRGQVVKESGTDAVTADVNGATGTVTSATALFITNGLEQGDTIHITAGTDVGYWTILSVDSETQVTVDTLESGPFVAVAANTYEATSSKILTNTDGSIVNINNATGMLTSVTGGLSAASPGDLLWIKDAAVTAHNGLYKIITVDTDNQITVDTSDGPFTVQNNLEFSVLKAGMFLQYKKDPIANTAPTSYSFDGNANTITRASGTWDSSIVSGTIIEVQNAQNPANNGSFTVLSRDSATQITLVSTDTIVTDATDATAIIDVYNTFKRTIGNDVYGFSWRLFSNGGTLQDVYEFVQHQLRQPTDVNYGPSVSRGDITDLLMEYTPPVATTLNMYIDDLSVVDINDVSFIDETGNKRSTPFIATGKITFNTYLQSDPNAIYRLFFLNDDAGDDLGRDFSTKDAIIVKDATGQDIAGQINGQSFVEFTYDYDGNTQRGAASAGTDAPVVLVCIGLDTAKYDITSSVITRATNNTIGAASDIERAYTNN